MHHQQVRYTNLDVLLARTVDKPLQFVNKWIEANYAGDATNFSDEAEDMEAAQQLEDDTELSDDVEKVKAFVAMVKHIGELVDGRRTALAWAGSPAILEQLLAAMHLQILAKHPTFGTPAPHAILAPVGDGVNVYNQIRKEMRKVSYGEPLARGTAKTLTAMLGAVKARVTFLDEVSWEDVVKAARLGKAEEHIKDVASAESLHHDVVDEHARGAGPATPTANTVVV